MLFVANETSFGEEELESFGIKGGEVFPTPIEYIHLDR